MSGFVTGVMSPDGGLTHHVSAAVTAAVGATGTVSLQFIGDASTTPATAAANSGAVIYEIDNRAPVLSFTTTPPALGGSQAVSFGVTSDEMVTLYRSINGSTAVPVVATETINLAFGSYTAIYYGIDAAGNRSADLTHLFVIREYPIATLTATPPAKSNNSMGSFVATADYAPVFYRWWVDGMLQFEGDGNFTTIPLADGPHVLEMAAVGPTGVEQPSKASYSWTVDTQPPSVPGSFDLSNDNGASTTDRIIDYNENIGFRGMYAEPSSTITVVMNGSIIRQGIVDAMGEWEVIFPLGPGYGSHYVEAFARDEAGNQSINSQRLSFTIASQGPVVASIQQPAAGGYRAGYNLEMFVTMDKPMTGYPNSGTLSYTYNGQSYDFGYEGVENGNQLIFRYLVPDGAQLNNVLGAGWTFNGITLDHGDWRDLDGNMADFSTVTAPVITNNIWMDGIRPALIGLPVVTDGTYGKGADIFLDWEFSEPVTVTGTPKIPLIIGDTYPNAEYVSGNGTNILRFKYTVPADVEGHLQVATSINPGALSGIWPAIT